MHFLEERSPFYWAKNIEEELARAQVKYICFLNVFFRKYNKKIVSCMCLGATKKTASHIFALIEPVEAANE